MRHKKFSQLAAPFTKRIPAKQDCQIALEEWLECWLAIENEHGKFIGWSGFNAPSQGMKQDMEIGYGLHPDHWGQGYITEAADLPVIIYSNAIQSKKSPPTPIWTISDRRGFREVWVSKCGVRGSKIPRPRHS